MASQTDKKEEFRRYLEKSNVLATLTNILTDLFEMEMRPDDPGQYMYQKFGESLMKAPASPTQPKKDDQERHRGDASTNHTKPTVTTEVLGSSTPSQGLDQLVSKPNQVDALMSEPPNDADETAATDAQAKSGETDQMHGQEDPDALPAAPASTSSPKENAEISLARESLGGSAPITSIMTLGQPSNLATLPAGSREQISGDPSASNTGGLPSQTSAQ